MHPGTQAVNDNGENGRSGDNGKNEGNGEYDEEGFRKTDEGQMISFMAFTDAFGGEGDREEDADDGGVE